MKKSNKIIGIAVVITTVLLIGTVVIAMLLGNTDNNTPPVDTSTITDTTTEPTPVIPVITTPEIDGSEEHPEHNPGEATVDIEKENDEHKRNPEPGIDGEVAVIPGVKEEGEGE